MKPIPFDNHPLLRHLEDNLRPLLDDTQRFCVAYSGGVDSHVLLYAIANLHKSNRIPTPMQVFHVNHGLSANAQQWSQHCAEVCAELVLPIEVLTVDARAERGESPEAKARTARYAALEAVTVAGDVWLTAHHQDDQAETFLLQLLRGAGVEGLSAMPFAQPFAVARLVRPLLTIARQEILDYAAQAELRWVEDESNEQRKFDRNFLRHELMPLLQQRWPSAPKTIARAAGHCAAAARMLGTDIGPLLATVQGSAEDRLSVPGLQHLSLDQQALLLRHWIHNLNFPLPAEAHILQIQTTVLGAQWDASPVVQWRGAEVRRYRDEVFIQAPLSEHDATRQWPWSLPDELDMETAGRLALVPDGSGQGLSLERLQAQGDIEVRFRQGGEQCRPQGRDTHSLKKLMQEWGIPPWLRDRVPLLYAADTLVAVAGFAVCEGFQAVADEPGYRLVWCPASAPMINSPSILADQTNSD